MRPGPLPVRRPAGRRAGSQAGGTRAEREGAGELRVAPRHLASPRPACFPETRAPPLRAGAGPLFGSALLRDLNFPQQI